jgi:hypothetical protein
MNPETGEGWKHRARATTYYQSNVVDSTGTGCRNGGERLKTSAFGSTSGIDDRRERPRETTSYSMEDFIRVLQYLFDEIKDLRGIYSQSLYNI